MSTWSAPRADRLFAIAQRILRDVDRAEDAFQDALVIAWRDLRALRDPDRFDAWLQQLLVTSASARRGGNGAAWPTFGCCRSTDRRRPTTSSRSPTGTSSNAGSGGCRPTSGSCSCCITSRATPRPRSPRSSASRRARSAPDCITPTARCAPLSRRTHAPGAGRSNGMTADRDIERLLDAWFVDGPTQVPDHVFDEAVDRVDRQPQRPAWRLPGGTPHDAYRSSRSSPWRRSSSSSSAASPCSASRWRHRRRRRTHRVADARADAIPAAAARRAPATPVTTSCGRSRATRWPSPSRRPRAGRVSAGSSSAVPSRRVLRAGSGSPSITTRR